MPAYHTGDAGTGLFDRDPATGDGMEGKWGHYGPDEELIPLTVPEVRRLLTRLECTESQPPDFIPAWPWWRWHHQARVRQCHQKRGLIL